MRGHQSSLIAGLAVLLVAVPAAHAAPGDPDGRLFTGDGRVATVDITLSDQAKHALDADPDTYVDGQVAVTEAGAGTAAVPVKASVRLKGGKLGSFRPLSGKAAFKVKFGKTDRPFGLKKLTLNNMVEDASSLHETLSYTVFRALGVAAPRTGYALVRVNGESYGLHLNVETLDDLSLPGVKHLYEGEYGADVTPGGDAGFEVDEGDAADRSDLMALITAANAPGDWSAAMAPVADLEQMTTMWAVEQYVGHWDGYAGPSPYPTLAPNNYYLRSDAAGRFTMVPWGTDQDWEQSVAFGDGTGLMFGRCQTDPACAAMYRRAVARVRAAVPALGLDTEAATLAAQLRSSQESDPRREQTMAQVDTAVAGVRDFIARRPSEADAWLYPQPPGGDGVGASSTGSTAVAAVVYRLASVGTTRRRGASLSTRVRVTGPGRLSQRIVRGGAGSRTLCAATARARRAGVVTLRCRLSKRAHRLVATRRVRVSVRTRFAPASGPAVTRARNATL